MYLNFEKKKKHSSLFFCKHERINAWSYHTSSENNYKNITLNTIHIEYSLFIFPFSFQFKVSKLSLLEYNQG